MIITPTADGYSDKNTTESLPSTMNSYVEISIGTRIVTSTIPFINRYLFALKIDIMIQK